MPAFDMEMSIKRENKNRPKEAIFYYKEVTLIPYWSAFVNTM